MLCSTPILMVMAGPNGSGKSTITAGYQTIGEYVNADDIQNHLSCDALKAAIIATNTREYLLSQQKDFTFETLLSTERNYDLMQRAKEMGYRGICIYVLTIDPKINISRVEQRKNKGGHYVQPEKVTQRFHRAMSLFPKLFDVCDECYVYDNSPERGCGEPSMIIKWLYVVLEYLSNDIWSVEMLKDLCAGKYLCNQ